MCGGVRATWLVTWCALIGAALARQRQHIYHNEFAVHVPAGADHVERIAAKHGFRNHGQIGSLKEYYLLSHHEVRRRSVNASAEHDARLRGEPHVRWVMQQRERRRVKRDYSPEQAALWAAAAPRHRTYNRALAAQAPPYFPDPLFKEQWYLNGGAKDGLDMNVGPAWARGYTGKGVVVSILDDGIQTNHPDLAQNYDPAASTDINGNDEDPTPQDNGDNKHGTRCAGEVAAVAYNQYCGVGIAYNASVGGVRMLDGVVNDAVEARALGLNPDHVDIYSASWGPEDDGKTVDGPGPLARRAFIYGVTSGRRGKGSIFVWASGNGGRHTDSCNCDGYTNSIFTLSISSATQGGYKPWYLEECSSTLASTYSSGTPGHDKSVATVDMDGRLRPDHMCTVEHTGTSASAPLAAGICALALEANPELTWRDMQYLVVMTSRSHPLEKENGWIVNGVKRKVSHKFGYGLMDAAEMVAMAERWSPVPPQHICKSQEITEDRTIEATYGYTLAAHMDVTGCRDTVNEVRHLEHVQCKISLRFFPRGNLRILLTSPAGTPSTLLFERPRDVVSSNFDDWPFLSVHFWGERAEGRWTLQVVNAGNRHVNQPGVLKKWQLIFYGTSVEPVRLRKRPVPSAPPPFSFPTAGDAFEQPAGNAFYNSDAYANFQNYPLFAAGSEPEKSVAALDGSPAPAPAPPAGSGQPRGVLLHGCDPECDVNGCYGAGPALCVGCRNHRLEESCVSRCPPRSYVAPDGRCLPCHESCETCAGAGRDACLTCAPAHLLLADLAVCLQQCPDGYYERASAGECLPCGAHCASCADSADTCASCDHHLVLHRGTCLAACPPATYETPEERCAPCDAACDTCTGPGAAQCALCRAGLYAHQGHCLSACPRHHYPDKKRRECITCEAGCAACSSGACISCDEGWTLGRKGRCTPDHSDRCQPAEFFSAGACERCHAACGACSGPAADQCLGCPPPFLLQQTRCVVACEAGHYAEGGRCARCPHACAACASRLNCTACAGALRLQSGACVPACARGFYADRALCSKCHLACETCSGPRRDHCVTCPPSWRLAAGECHPDCPEGFLDSEHGCIKCHHYCRTCNGAGPLQCTSCPPHRTLQDGRCAECAAGRYYAADERACRGCHASCLACVGPRRNDCLSCAPPLRLDRVNNACVPCCPEPLRDLSNGSTPDADTQPECCRCDHTGECRHSSAAGKRRTAEATAAAYRIAPDGARGADAGAGAGGGPGAVPLALAVAVVASGALLLLFTALQRVRAGGGPAYTRLPRAESDAAGAAGAPHEHEPLLEAHT